MNVFSEKYIRNTERGTIRWLMLLESPQFLIGNPEWWFTKPLLVVLTSPKTSALVPDVAAKNCLPQTKSPGSNTEVLATDSCFATVTILLCCPVSSDGQAPLTAAALALCDDGQSAVPHGELHTGLQGAEPSKPVWRRPVCGPTVSCIRGCRGLSPANLARLHHYLTLFPATLFCWLWLCPSHIAGSVLPGILVPFPAQKLLNFFNHKVCLIRQTKQQSSDLR